VPPHETENFERAAKKALIDVTAIGMVEADNDTPCFLDQDGTRKDFAGGSFSHF
jgi:hypothetical protein